MKKKDLLIYSWNDVASISRNLALTIFKNEKIDLVVGITRGGCCIATIISEMLRKNMITLCSTRRENDVEIHEEPVLISSSCENVISGKRILLVDEIIVTGKTLEVVKKELIKLGAFSVKTCVIANRSKGKYESDYCFVRTNKNNVIFPWDYLIIGDKNKVIVHPEYKNMCEELEVDLYGM